MTEVLVDPIRVLIGLMIAGVFCFFIGLRTGMRHPTRAAIKQELLFMGHRDEEQERGRLRIQDEIARRLARPQDLDENMLMADGAFQRHVIQELRALRAETNQLLHMEELMATTMSDVQAAVDAAKKSADRANANTEKVLTKVDQLAIDLKAALASGSDPVVLAAIATELAGVSGSLDTESAKVDADPSVNPPAPPAPPAPPVVGPGPVVT